MRMMFQRLPNFGHMRPMHANRFMQLLAGDMKLLGPIMDIRCKFRIDLIGVVGTFSF